MNDDVVSFTSVEEATAYVDSYDGEPESFEMKLAADMTMGGKWVPFDLAMAAIADRVISRGWKLAGVSDDNGLKTYRVR